MSNKSCTNNEWWIMEGKVEICHIHKPALAAQLFSVSVLDRNSCFFLSFPPFLFSNIQNIYFSKLSRIILKEFFIWQDYIVGNVKLYQWAKVLWISGEDEMDPLFSLPNHLQEILDL